jgi:hypothetical protein
MTADETRSRLPRASGPSPDDQGPAAGSPESPDSSAATVATLAVGGSTKQPGAYETSTTKRCPEQQQSVGSGFTTDGCFVTIRQVRASCLRLVVIGWFRQQVEVLGREEVANRLECSLQHVDYLKRGAREVSTVHLGKLAESMGRTVQDLLLELSNVATSIDHGKLTVEIDASVEEPKLRGRKASELLRDEAAISDDARVRKSGPSSPKPPPRRPSRPRAGKPGG